MYIMYIAITGITKFSVPQSSGASPVDIVTSSREVKAMITILEKKFDDLKDTIIQHLEKCKVLVI